MASKVQQYRAINSLMLELPGLVSELLATRADSAFIAFLARAETMLKDFGKRQAADLAAARSRIAASGIFSESRTRSRKDRSRIALEQVGAVQAALAEAILPIEQAMDDARPILRQMIQLVGASRAIAITEPEMAGTLPEAIWNLAASHEQLAPLAVQAKVHLGRSDALALLLMEIEIEDFLPLKDGV